MDMGDMKSKKRLMLTRAQHEEHEWA